MTHPAPPRFRLVLAKEDFKFSVAHFTVFSPDDAELLHGHNYHVSVEVAGPGLDDYGLLADIAILKAEIRRLCAELDSHTLLPTENPLVKVEVRGRTRGPVPAARPAGAAEAGEQDEPEGEVEVHYADRRYLLPAAEVRLLPLHNTSMELLARYLWQRLEPHLTGTPVDFLSISVAETKGQKAVYEQGR